MIKEYRRIMRKVMRIVRGNIAATPKELQIIRHEINRSEKSNRIILHDNHGHGYETKVIPGENSYPDYFKGKGYTRNYFLDHVVNGQVKKGCLDKAIRGERLTKLQVIAINDLLTGYNEQVEYYKNRLV